MNIPKILAAGALASTFAFAQEGAAPKADLNSKPGLGIHGDFNYSYLIGLPQDWYLGDDADAPSGIGFDVGFRGRIPMASILQFAPEINFHYAQLAMDEEGCDHKFKQMDLEAPLMMRALVKDRFYVAAGVQLSLSLSNEVSLEQEDIKLGAGLGTTDFKYKENVEQAGFGFGLAFGVGGFVMERLSIDAGFVLGLTDTYPDVDPEENDLIDSMDGGKQMTFKVGAGFWFL